MMQREGFSITEACRGTGLSRAGFYPDISTAARAMVQVVRRIEPDARRHAAYQPFYQAYKETYAALAGTLHRQVAASG